MIDEGIQWSHPFILVVLSFKIVPRVLMPFNTKEDNIVYSKNQVKRVRRALLVGASNLKGRSKRCNKIIIWGSDNGESKSSVDG